MKSSYFGYYLSELETGDYITFELTSFLDKFIEDAPLETKNSIRYNGEYLYLFKDKVPGCYLFIMSKSSDIAHSMNTKKYDHTSLDKIIKNGNYLGFASYLYITDMFLSIASTTNAPKHGALNFYISEIFKFLRITQYSFNFHALLQHSSKKDILSMQFIGKTSVHIDKKNSIVKELFNLLSVENEDIVNLDDIEIIFRPKRSKNIKQLADKALTSFSDDIRKYVTKAKNEEHERLTDLYLLEQGHISDTINTRNKSLIFNDIIDKATQNTTLNSKAKEFYSDDRFQKQTAQMVNHYIITDSWNNNLPTV